MEFAHFVKSRKKRKNNGIFQKWKPTILRLGMEAEKHCPKIARCCVKTAIEPNQVIKQLKIKNFGHKKSPTSCELNGLLNRITDKNNGIQA